MDRTATATQIATSGRDPHPMVDVVIPVYNEEGDLDSSVRRLDAHLRSLPFAYRITIADNASTDATPFIGEQLARELPNVTFTRLAEKGRGRALRLAWLASDADVLCYMDVDLSTELEAFLPLVAPLISGHSHMAIGSRLAPGAHVQRGPKREFISRGYNLILKGTLAARFSDAQCGFKAIRRDVAQELIPHVLDNGWFFDTEMLVLAERSGLRIHEVPVDWVDDPDSRVDIVATAVGDLRGVARLARAILTGRVPAGKIRRKLLGEDSVSSFSGQVTRFAAIGVLSTVAYVCLFLGLRVWMPPQGANVVALVSTAVANTAANRRFTFGLRGPNEAVRHQLQGLGIFAVGLALTAAALGGLHRFVPDASRLLEVSVLVAANLIVTIVRFLALRAWVFAPHRHDPKEQR